MKIIPLIVYSNIKRYKLIIRKQNNNKSGIYRWNNLITGKSYVGSAINLSDRFRQYFSPDILKKNLLKSRSLIHNSILKYDYDNFNLEIIEYCEPFSLIKREQYYLDILNPEYNICKIAGSTFGKKHTEETKKKIALALKGRKLSFEARIKLKGRKPSTETLAKLKGRKLSFEALAKLKLARAKVGPLRKINLLLVVAYTTIVINIIDNSIKTYDSIREAARNLSVSHTAIRKCINTGKLLRNTYSIIIKK